MPPAGWSENVFRIGFRIGGLLICGDWLTGTVALDGLLTDAVVLSDWLTSAVLLDGSLVGVVHTDVWLIGVVAVGV